MPSLILRPHKMFIGIHTLTQTHTHTYTYTVTHEHIRTHIRADTHTQGQTHKYTHTIRQTRHADTTKSAIKCSVSSHYHELNFLNRIHGSHQLSIYQGRLESLVFRLLPFNFVAFDRPTF